MFTALKVRMQNAAAKLAHVDMRSLTSLALCENATLLPLISDLSRLQQIPVVLGCRGKTSGKWQGGAGVQYVDTSSEQQIYALRMLFRRMFQHVPIMRTAHSLTDPYPPNTARSSGPSCGSSGKNLFALIERQTGLPTL